MKQEIFKSDRYFTLFDIVISHGQLLLRSQKTPENEDNIDIIFSDTNYIQTFSRLRGICIKKIQNSKDIISYGTVEKYLSYDNNNIFEIESNGERYYIAASFVKVFENKLEFNESSLNFGNNGREREIASSIN